MLRYLALLALATRYVSGAFVDYTLNIVNSQISPDGFSRQASLVNGQFPGTVLFANKGDTLRNTVVNQLTDPSMRRSTTIHWHGLFQRTTAYEDGPAFVTQCPIAPNATYQYVIPLRDQAGTHWYHSHLGSQYVDGVRSAIVIYDPNDPHKNLYDVDDASTVIQLSDWYHTPAPALGEEYISSGNEPVPDSGLINGRGRYKGGPAAPWSVFTVQKGKRYRFRVVNNGALGYYTFQIDGHPLKIIEADGIAHQPYTVNSLDIHPGERYSIVVEANRTVGNYWIRAPITARRSSDTLDPELVKAVLRYEGASNQDPTTSKSSGLKLDQNLLKPVENPGAPGGSAPADVVIDLNYGGVSGGVTGWQVNDSQYKPPTLPTLLKILSNNASSNADFARSENTIVLPYNKVIELQIHGSSNGFFHPWHLHGHAFDIVENGGAVNYVNPPRKDVVPVGGSTARIRFRTDNPGPWFLHCHIDWHLEVGLAVVFAEAPNEQRTGPLAIQPSPGWSELCPKYAALPPALQ
ncbi:laccase, multicopper oxidase, benzenediol:oxygen oxidorectuctase [Rhizoctonia solani]|uniref:Laccase, multicopper oxidase, benzenediol:oxygen oxidorectuctase n=1 Tax=Rhizoctonia solani TaxID=456999 RepID=A0A0K6FLX2_9AGAM|nr:laccase, multicopper oxidase, benzenediol:oxygen oxidorectuctase [Rhizoctonia solani]